MKKRPIIGNFIDNLFNYVIINLEYKVTVGKWDVFMQKENRRITKRVRNLVVISVLSAILLTVATYAWFIGMRTVNVSSFDVEIATTDSLLLSLDGATWGTTVAISEDTLSEVSYEGNTNNWGGRGLIPMSSIGAMDTGASRMKLFEKASLTPTKGGYRLMASRVHNYEQGNPEQSGYVTFDLFVKNFTGTQYIKDLNILDEESIYLTVDSKVKVATGGVEDTGIENSVRVAFAQIGRVIGTTTDASVITGISCTGDTNVTGLCRTAQIWEPNDTDHVQNAISWYETSCLARTAADVTDPESYSGSCGQVIDGLAYPTYSVDSDILSSDNVDVYDGAAYNKYAPAEPVLTSYDYFTDTEKLLTGVNRPEFMSLAPNSITKVRVYIYLEGQDVDNYDFAAIGKKISIAFGFTKDRFTEDDINYNGPDLNQGTGPNGSDLTAPVITLTGDSIMTLTKGTAFVDPGATATDNIDPDLTASIVATGTVNINVPGTYRVTYTVVDAAGNVATKTRAVIVQN